MRDSAEAMRRLVARINANAYLPPDIGIYIAERKRTMAKQVKLAKGRTFEFKAGKSGGSKYPWAEWLSGELLMLEQAIGTGFDEKGNVIGITDPRDFAVGIEQMIPKVKTAGRKKYMVVDVSRYDQNGVRLKDAIIIRARPMLEIERIDEDKKRIVEKARDEAARAKRLAAGGADQDDDEPNGDDDMPSDVE